jgi:ubiquitin carboxyl-terminal hydrolase 14
LVPANRKLKEVEKERGERRKIRKRTKAAGGASSSSTAVRAEASGDVEMSDAATATASATATTSNDENTSTQDKGKAVPGGDLEDEGIYRAKEAGEFEALVDSSLKNDLGCSTTGFYELVGPYFFFSILMFSSPDSFYHSS